MVSLKAKMRLAKLSYLLGVALLFALPVWANAKLSAYRSEWKVYDVHPGQYSVLLPTDDDNPEHFVFQAPLGIAGKSIPGLRYRATEDGNDEVMYVVDYFILPTEVAREGLPYILKRLQADYTVPCKPISLRNATGLECFWQDADYQLLNHYYLLTNRFYIVSVIWSAGTNKPENARKFFESFTIH